jgi:hypothetical protein
MMTFFKNQALRAALVLLVVAILAAPSAAQSRSDDQDQVQHQIERARIYRDAYPLIAEVDLYCAIYVQEADVPELRITAAERGYEKILYSDNDVVFLNKGKQDGVEIGQIYLAVEIGNQIGGFGHLASKRGQVHVIFVEDSRSAARVEKSCGRLMVGNYLVPFEEKESLLGKDLGYEKLAAGNAEAMGTVIYLERDYNQIGSGGWAIVDVGEEAGLQVGQQLTIYKMIREPETLKAREDLPRIGIGNAIVIETGKKTATIKVLSCSDPISIGQQVQSK